MEIQTPVLTTPWLTVQEAVAYSRRHMNTIGAALRDGRLRGAQTQKNGKWLIHRDDLDAWIRGEIAPAHVAPKVTSRRSA